MGWFDYAFIAMWFGGALYIAWTGVRMIASKEHAQHIAKLWLKFEDDADNRRSKHYVKFVEGPLRLFIGMGLLAYGVYLWIL